MITMHTMWRVALVAACACTLGGTASAQDLRGTVEGVVLSADGARPIAEARVGVYGLGGHVASDSLGRFELMGVAFGSQRLEVRAIGFQPTAHAVTVVPGETTRIEIRLKPAVVNLPELVVSSSREEQLASTTPVSIGVIQGEEIRETRGHHPSEIVNRTPGVYVSNFGGEGHATAIRQPITTKALYAYLEDGVPIRSTGFFNHNALYEINIPQAGRLEVIKGPGTAVYGSDAVGGVVNAFTRDPSPTPEAEVFLEGGSSTYVRGLGTASTTVGGDGFRADVNVTRADGWRDGTPYDRQSGTLRWDHTLGDRARLKTIAALSHVDQPGDGGSDLIDGGLHRAAVADLLADRVPARDGRAPLHRAPGPGRSVLLRRHALHPIQRARPAPVVAAELRSAGLGEPPPLGRRADALPHADRPAPDQPEHRGRSRVHPGQPAGDRRSCPSAQARSSPDTPTARSSTTTTSPSGRPRPTRRRTSRCPAGCS